jgi:hypothetical protein
MNRTFAAVLALAAVLAAHPAGAQPFRSDVRGPDVTGSGIARYPSLTTRDLEGALFKQAGGEGTAFRSPAVGNAMLAEAVRADSAVCAARLQHPPEWPDSLRVDPGSQFLVCQLLNTQERQREIATLLTPRQGPGATQAVELASALSGLMRGMNGPERSDAPGRWKSAIDAYDAYLQTVPDAWVANPPPVLVAIALVLDRVVDAGLLAAER